MKRAAVFAALVAAAMAGRPTHRELDGYTFAMYVKDFQKAYDGAEYTRRERIFNAQIATVRAHNAGASTYKKGVNKFSDWTAEEKRRLRGNRVAMKKTMTSKPERIHASSKAPLPRFVDYRTAQPPVLTAVKDQGQCGSCWAHAATEGLESHHALATGRLYVLSQQQLVSCTPTPNDCGGSGGCNGAVAESAYDYLVKAGGQIEEWEWGYTSYYGDNGVCKLPQKIYSKVGMTGYTKVPHNDAAAVMDAVARAGPLAISVDASAWDSYESGVYDGCSYAKNISMDHAVQLVGYGHDLSLGVDYWLVRNSWSADYGEYGYIRLLRRKKTECGWNVNPQDGDGCKGQTAPEWACGECGIAYDTLYPNVATGN